VEAVHKRAEGDSKAKPSRRWARRNLVDVAEVLAMLAPIKPNPGSAAAKIDSEALGRRLSVRQWRRVVLVAMAILPEASDSAAIAGGVQPGNAIGKEGVVILAGD
jgi:hypothetical protein